MGNVFDYFLSNKTSVWSVLAHESFFVTLSTVSWTGPTLDPLQLAQSEHSFPFSELSPKSYMFASDNIWTPFNILSVFFYGSFFWCQKGSSDKFSQTPCRPLKGTKSSQLIPQMLKAVQGLSFLDCYSQEMAVSTLFSYAKRGSGNHHGNIL